MNFRSASRDQLTVNNFVDHFVCFDEIALFVIFYKQNQLQNLSNKKSMDLVLTTFYIYFLQLLSLAPLQQILRFNNLCDKKVEINKTKIIYPLRLPVDQGITPTLII